MIDLIITRPEPDASRFKSFLAERDVSSVLSPVMSIVYVDEAQELPNLSGVNAFAFTSANGVRALTHCIAQNLNTQNPTIPDPTIPDLITPDLITQDQPPPNMAASNCSTKALYAQGLGENSGQSYLDLTAYAIGDGTARAARHAGFTNVKTANGDMESLADFILKHEPANRLIYHSAGRDRQGDLVTRLLRGGLAARREILYKAHAIDHISVAAKKLIVDTNWHGAVGFFSPRSARLFLDQIRAGNLENHLGRLTALCLSNAVAAVVMGKDIELTQSHKWKAVKVAKEMTIDGMRDLLTP